MRSCAVLPVGAGCDSGADAPRACSSGPRLRGRGGRDVGLGATFPLKVLITGVDGLTAPMRGTLGKLGSFGQKAGRMVRGAARVGALGLGVLAVQSVTTGIAFEKSVNKLAAKANIEGKALEKLTTQAQNLGRSTVFTSRRDRRGHGCPGSGGPGSAADPRVHSASSGSGGDRRDRHRGCRRTRSRLNEGDGPRVVRDDPRR